MTAKPIPKEPVDHKALRKDRQKCLRALRRYLVKRLLPLAACLVATCAQGASVTLAWNANPETNIVGYKIYWGTSSRAYSNVVNVTTGAFTWTNVEIQFTVTNLASSSRFFFSATAYNTLGLESDLSAEVNAVTAPQVVVWMVTNSLQWSTNAAGPWTNVSSTVSVVSNGWVGFFRARVDMGTASIQP